MCCLAGIAGLIGPRVALAVWWIFGDKVQAVFSSWIWALLGLIFLPWTTLFYVIAWSAIGGVNGAWWIFVALGVALDIGSYSARAAKARYA
jgi:hypothetical protein